MLGVVVFCSSVVLQVTRSNPGGGIFLREIETNKGHQSTAGRHMVGV